MYQKLLIVFFALFIITKSNANEININNISHISQIIAFEEVDEVENYDEIPEQKDCLIGCIKKSCTKENIQLGGEIIDQVIDIVKDIYDIVK
jgi:hypothetical protein